MSYARMQHELAEARMGKLPESHGYGGSAVSARPAKRARKQIEDFEEDTKDRSDLASMGLSSQKLRELRSQYGSEATGGPTRLADVRPEHRKRSATRCAPHRDVGLTEGAEGGQRCFCLDFCRGRCSDGGECSHRHEIPRKADDADSEVLNATYDIFGRKRSLLLSHWERHHGKKEEGADQLRATALHVSGLRAPAKKRSELCGGKAGTGKRSAGGDLDAAVRRSFSAFGEVIESRVVLDAIKGHWAIVTYSSRAAAEFAKEAMTGQGLKVDSGEILQVRWAKDQTQAQASGGYTTIAPKLEPVPHAPGVAERIAKATAAKEEKAPAAPPAAAADAPLPAGWASTLDAASGRSYYHNGASGETTWERPAPAPGDVLPAGWAAVVAGGVRYYHNATSGETTWDRPGA